MGNRATASLTKCSRSYFSPAAASCRPKTPSLLLETLSPPIPPLPGGQGSALSPHFSGRLQSTSGWLSCTFRLAHSVTTMSAVSAGC